MVTFLKTESQLNIVQIKEVEDYVGLKFPKEYKEHLLRYNGGKCSPNIFKFNEKGKLTNSNIDWFLAIYDGVYDNLKYEIELVKIGEKRMPIQILPIAHDSGGNLICISCGGQDEGYVYFWDHENEVDYSISNDNDYSNLYLISESFNSFIDKLTDLSSA